MTTPAHQLLAQAPSSWRRAPKTAHFVLVVGAGLAMAEIFRLKSKAHAATAAPPDNLRGTGSALRHGTRRGGEWRRKGLLASVAACGNIYPIPPRGGTPSVRIHARVELPDIRLSEKHYSHLAAIHGCPSIHARAWKCQVPPRGDIQSKHRAIVLWHAHQTKLRRIPNSTVGGISATLRRKVTRQEAPGRIAGPGLMLRYAPA